MSQWKNLKVNLLWAEESKQQGLASCYGSRRPNYFKSRSFMIRGKQTANLGIMVAF